MPGELYLTNAYLRGCEATVDRHLDDGVILSDTVFYPTGGGQPGDSGELRDSGGRVWRVTTTEKSPEGVLHRLEGEASPPLAERVHAAVDWNRRYDHMRYHTALHILSGVTFREFGSGITGGQIYDDRARMDFAIPEFNRTRAEELVAAMNVVVGEDRPISVRFLSREELARNPSLVRVAAELMPDLNTVRLIDIEGFDVQADGGTHVASTREVGQARLDRIENKGSRNKRMYLSLEPSKPAP